MPRKPKLFSQQLRKAIDISGLSRYRICKTTGMGEATMSRFMKKRGGLSIEMLDRVAALLELEIVARKKEGAK
jgi:transcriptional regulator with XRE-family HTH domain